MRIKPLITEQQHAEATKSINDFKKFARQSNKEMNMSRRFDYVKYDPQAIIQQSAFKEKFQELENMAEGLKDGRAKSLVMTYLEITYMWIGKALRDEQIARNPESPDVPERTKE